MTPRASMRRMSRVNHSTQPHDGIGAPMRRMPHGGYGGARTHTDLHPDCLAGRPEGIATRFSTLPNWHTGASPLAEGRR